MSLNRAAVAVCLTVCLSSCGPSEFKGGGGGGGDAGFSSQFWQQGEHFYMAVWPKDAEDPAMLLVARVGLKTSAWGSISTSGYYDDDKAGCKFELKDYANKKSWAIYDAVPESSKESVLVDAQSFDLNKGRVFLLDTTKARSNVVQLDGTIPNMQSGPEFESKQLVDGFRTLAESHQEVKDFLEVGQ